MKRTGAWLAVYALEQIGARFTFGIPGVHTTELYDALNNSNRITQVLVTHEGVPADVVYTMTKSLFDNLDTMTAAHAAAKAIKRENATKGMPVPLHPGAEKYYKEIGLIK